MGVNTSTEYAGVELVGVTGTFYTDREDARVELSLETAENMAEAGVPYIVIDSSPPEHHEWVSAAHRARGAVVLPAVVGGIATQRMEGVAYAVGNGAERVLSAEPEKVRMPYFASRIAEALRSTDVLVIGRTQEAEDSLPPHQQFTERLAGWILEQTHQLPADALSGGRGFTRAGAEILAEYPAGDPGMNNWIYLYDTPLVARGRGLDVDGITVELVHPDSMVEQETGDPVFDRKRDDQFMLQLDYLLRRSDVDPIPRAQHIARMVLKGLEGVGKETSLLEFNDRIAKIELGLFSFFGYKPAPRLQKVY
jgi:hypothetical protein